MPRKKIQKKQNIELPKLASLKVPYNVFFAIVLSLGVGISGLLYGASYRVSAMHIPTPVSVNPHAVLESDVREVVTGFPIEAMAPYIAKHNKTVAAFLVGIAKKESNWGKRIPVDSDGADCYNYWGYKGAGSRGTAMGHGCFGSPEEAIGIVGGRLDTFVLKYKFDTPEDLIVWKCGWNCDTHSKESVRKWISDVGIYFDKVKKN